MKDVNQYLSQFQEATRNVRVNNKPHQSALRVESLQFLELIKNWQAIVGERLAAHTIPLKFKDLTLTILSDHPAFSDSMSYLSQEIIHKVKEEYPSFRTKLNKLKFITDPAFFQNRLQEITQELSEKKNSVFNIPHKNSPLYNKLAKEAEELTVEVDDAEDRELLKSLFIQLNCKK